MDYNNLFQGSRLELLIVSGIKGPSLKLESTSEQSHHPEGVLHPLPLVEHGDTVGHDNDSDDQKRV